MVSVLIFYDPEMFSHLFFPKIPPFALTVHRDPYEHLLDVGKCTVEWNHGDHAEVGTSSAATVKVSKY